MIRGEINEVRQMELIIIKALIKSSGGYQTTEWTTAQNWFSDETTTLEQSA